MRFINPNWYLSLLLGFILFHLCRSLFTKKKKYQKMLIIISGLLFILTLHFPLASIGGYFINFPLYCHFRSLPLIEVLIILSAPLWGFLCAYCTEESSGKIAARKNRIKYQTFLALSLIYISSIYIKPIIRPIETYGAEESWVNDVAIQSATATAGPACLATILHSYGPTKQEMNIAKHAYTSGNGTELWYLTRYAKKQGLHYQYLQADSISDIKTPAILEVGTFYGAGHFITILENDQGTYYVGDPMVGDLYLTEDEFHEKYTFTGFAVSLYKP